MDDIYATGGGMQFRMDGDSTNFVSDQDLFNPQQSQPVQTPGRPAVASKTVPDRFKADVAPKVRHTSRPKRIKKRDRKLVFEVNTLPGREQRVEFPTVVGNKQKYIKSMSRQSLSALGLELHHMMTSAKNRLELMGQDLVHLHSVLGLNVEDESFYSSALATLQTLNIDGLLPDLLVDDNQNTWNQTSGKEGMSTEFIDKKGRRKKIVIKASGRGSKAPMNEYSDDSDHSHVSTTSRRSRKGDKKAVTVEDFFNDVITYFEYPNRILPSLAPLPEDHKLFTMPTLPKKSKEKGKRKKSTKPEEKCKKGKKTKAAFVSTLQSLPTKVRTAQVKLSKTLGADTSLLSHSLAQRLVQILIEQPVTQGGNVKQGGGAGKNPLFKSSALAARQRIQSKSKKSGKAQYTFLDRIKKELRYVGLINSSSANAWDADLDNRQDDAVAEEIRYRQNELVRLHQSTDYAAYRRRMYQLNQELLDKQIFGKLKLLEEQNEQIEKLWKKKSACEMEERKRLLAEKKKQQREKNNPTLSSATRNHPIRKVRPKIPTSEIEKAVKTYQEVQQKRIGCSHQDLTGYIPDVSKFGGYPRSLIHLYPKPSPKNPYTHASILQTHPDIPNRKRKRQDSSSSHFVSSGDDHSAEDMIDYNDHEKLSNFKKARLDYQSATSQPKMIHGSPPSALLPPSPAFTYTKTVKSAAELNLNAPAANPSISSSSSSSSSPSSSSSLLSSLSRSALPGQPESHPPPATFSSSVPVLHQNTGFSSSLNPNVTAYYARPSNTIISYMGNNPNTTVRGAESSQRASVPNHGSQPKNSMSLNSMNNAHTRRLY